MTGSRRYIERITVQTRTVSKTETGRPVETWTNVFNRRASVVGGRSVEGIQNQQHQNSKDFTIRFPRDNAAAALDPQDTRVIWHSKDGNKTLNLTGSDTTTGRRPDLVWTATTDKD